MRVLRQMGLTVVLALTGACAHQPPLPPPPPPQAAQDDPPMVTQTQLEALGSRIDATPYDSADRPVLMHHLAELYLQESHFLAAHPERADAAQMSRHWRHAGAQELLDTIHLPAFRSYPRADEVLFEVIRELLAVYDDATARKICKRLITEYPDSEYLPDAFFAFGEFNFATHSWDLAARYYEKVLDFGESRVSEAARRQLAACAAKRR